MLSVLMTFALLFSTFSFSVEKHFCGTHLIDTAVFSKVKKCEMEKHSKTPMKKKCCKDEIEIVKGQDELKLNAFENLSFNHQCIIVAHAYYYNNLFENLPKQIIPHKDYSPPNLIRDIQVLDRVYLI